MRWPEEKNKKNKKTRKNKTTTSNHKTKNKANKTETKATLKRKTNTRNTKTPKPSKPRWTTMSHPRKPPKTGKTKTSIFNTFETMPDTPKTNLLILKPQKNKPQKTPFCHVQKQPTIFHKFSVFSTYSFCFWTTVFCWKHYKNNVFRKTQLFKNTVSKTHFFNHVKNTLFQKKVSFLFFFCNFRWNPNFYSVSCFALFWSKKHFWPKQIVCTKMRVFSPFLTQIVSGNFC